MTRKSGTKGKARFSKAWCDEGDFKDWLRESKDNNDAYCLYCKKTFSLSNMGRTSVVSHSNSGMHTKYLERLRAQPTMKQVLMPALNKETMPAPHVTTENSMPLLQSATNCNKQTNLSKFVTSQDTVRADALWVLATVSTHITSRAAETLGNILPVMFPDSVIASSMQCHRTKIGYIASCGLGPLFQQDLHSKIKDHIISVSFDESLNKVVQKTQMDIHVRYRAEDILSGRMRIMTSYLTSEFLQSATAVSLLKHFFKGLGDIDQAHVLSVSIDGPNVNWTFMDLLKKDRDEGDPDAPKLIQFGSCSLHVVHGSLKTGHAATGWVICDFLRSIYYLFNNFPSRKGKYTKLTQCKQFPAKFCTTRWTENENPATVAIQILPSIRKYVAEVKLPNSKVYKKVKTMLEDPLLEAKLGFFQGMSNKLRVYLKMFQGDKPMVPFLYDALNDLLLSLLRLIVKKEVLDKVKDAKELLHIDLDNVNKVIHPRDLQLFNACKQGIKNANKLFVKNVSDKDILNLKEQCFKFVKAAISKLKERCPLRYPITEDPSCLAPRALLDASNVGLQRLDICLDQFLELRRVDGIEADEIREDYLKVFTNPEVIKIVKDFKVSSDRLDDLFVDIAKAVPVSDALSEFILVIHPPFPFFY